MTTGSDLGAAGPWAEELAELRRIALAGGLTEEVKWRSPCFTSEGRNILLLGRRKDHCLISFLRGALLDDPRELLESAGPNTRSARLIRFTDRARIQAEEPALRALIASAVAVERAGLRLPPPGDVPALAAEIERRLDADPGLRAAFQGLTPGRQRAYNLHVSQAKQARTRELRFERCVARILAGKGPNDCTCGRTKRPPGCDGSHKHPA